MTFEPGANRPYRRSERADKLAVIIDAADFFVAAKQAMLQAKQPEVWPDALQPQFEAVSVHIARTWGGGFPSLRRWAIRLQRASLKAG